MSVRIDNSSPQQESHINPTSLSTTSIVSTIVSNASNDNFMNNRCKLTPSLSTSSLALTPKTHNKRTRHRMDPSSSDSKSNANNLLPNSDSFDCNSLRRSLKRVRLTIHSSCCSPRTKACTSPSSSLLCAKNSKSPGEIRLQKDIQHAVLMQNWRPILPRLQLKQRYEIESENLDDRLLDKPVVEPHHSSLLIPIPLNFDKDTERLSYGDEESDDDDDDAWRLPTYSYDVESDVLQPSQPLSKTSRVEFHHSDSGSSGSSSSISCSIGVGHSNRDVSVKVFRKSYDPMYIILHVTIPVDCGQGDSQNTLVVLLQLHFPRLYPHQPPIIRRIDNFSLNSRSNDADHNAIMKSFLAKSASLAGGMTSSSMTSPTIWIASSPSECSGHQNNSLSNAGGRSSDHGKLIVLTQWTPVSRLNDIIEMLVHAICRYFCCISGLKTVDGPNSLSMKSNRNSNPMPSRLTLLFGADEKKDEEQGAMFPLNVDGNSFCYSYRNDDASSTATNLTPTMSNTTRRVGNLSRQLQSLHSPQLDDDWKLSHSDDDENQRYGMYDHSDSFASNDMRYRSPTKATTGSDDEFDDDDQGMNNDPNDDDDDEDFADAVECNSMSVQYNRSCSSASYASSVTSGNNNGTTDRIVDVVFSVHEAFPPGRFNQGYISSTNNNFEPNANVASTLDPHNAGSSLQWYSSPSQRSHPSTIRHNTFQENDMIGMTNNHTYQSPTTIFGHQKPNEDDISMMDS
jgi:hypothetical protein